MAELANVQKAALKARVARADLEIAIRAAHKAGASLRAIADKAGVSYETVRRLTTTLAG